MTDTPNPLRDALLEAISKDTGWEESAVHMVDNVVLPVIRQHAAKQPQNTTRTECAEPELTGEGHGRMAVGGNHTMIERLTKLADHIHGLDSSSAAAALLYDAVAFMGDAAIRKDADSSRPAGTTSPETLIQEMEALRLEKPYDSAIERVHDAVLNSCIELVRKHTPSEIRVVDESGIITQIYDCMPEEMDDVWARLIAIKAMDAIRPYVTSQEQEERPTCEILGNAVENYIYDKIESMVNEFGHDPKACLGIIGEYVGEARHHRLLQAKPAREAQPAGEISVVKPGTLPVDIDKTLSALHTQYQIRGDAIVPRASAEAPTIEQMSLIREAHLNIIPILKALKAAQREREAQPAGEIPVNAAVKHNIETIRHALKVASMKADSTVTVEQTLNPAFRSLQILEYELLEQCEPKREIGEDWQAKYEKLKEFVRGKWKGDCSECAELANAIIGKESTTCIEDGSANG